MKKTFDEIVDEVAKERGYSSWGHVYGCLSFDLERTIVREAAEQYSKQVELPSDEEIVDLLAEKNPQTKPFYFEQRIYGAKWMRDQIKKQLNEKI